MSTQAFNQLKKNIGKEGHLESLPLCILQGEEIFIISGHHRIRAARAAGIKKDILILLYTKPLTKSQIRAKQLAHNSIAGEDNKQILAEIFLEIDTFDDKEESFIDPKILGLDSDIKNLENIEKAIPSFINVSFIFLKEDQAILDKALLEACEDIKKQDALYTTSMEDWERFKTALRLLKTKAQIISVGSGIKKMCQIVLAHYQDNNQESSNRQDATPSG
jgi:ParB-like chromosome segregation protein Spo0J